jgi:hypothetical protein
MSKDNIIEEFFSERISREVISSAPKKNIRSRLFRLANQFKQISLKSKSLVYLLLLILVASLSLSIYYYRQYRKLKNSDPQIQAQEETNRLIKQLGAIMELSNDETPSLLTVQDKNKLNDKLFFKNAQNGDKVLVYSKNQEIILYRPQTKKIIAAAPMDLSSSSQSNNTIGDDQQIAKTDNQPPADTAQNASNDQAADQLNQIDDQVSLAEPQISTRNANSSLNVILENGTKTAGLATKMKPKLESIAGVIVTSIINAQKNDYKQTIVVDLTQKNSQLAQEIAQAVGGTISSLPDGESRPDNADILIIAGK